MCCCEETASSAPASASPGPTPTPTRTSAPTLDWIHFESDIPLIIEEIRKHPRFVDYLAYLAEELDEDFADFVFGDPEGDILADVESWDTWYKQNHEREEYMTLLPELFRTRAMDRKDRPDMFALR